MSNQSKHRITKSPRFEGLEMEGRGSLDANWIFSCMKSSLSSAGLGEGQKAKNPTFFLHNSAKKSLGNWLQRLALQEDGVVGDPQGINNVEGNSSKEQLVEKSART